MGMARLAENAQESLRGAPSLIHRCPHPGIRESRITFPLGYGVLPG